MKLIVEPEAGASPILAAIKQARKSIDVVIFRVDRMDICDALATSVRHGVNVRALIAHRNSGGQRSLRKLEMRLLDSGATVTRTADDLVRYHGKLMIVDQRVLHLYGFNFTWLDMKRTRSFGIITRNRRLVDEALKLFEADSGRQRYTPGCDRFVVSPENARERLTAFIAGARKQLLIYDPKLTDPTLARKVLERLKAGLDVRIIGKVGKAHSLTAAKYAGARLHVRAIVRDGHWAFLGSQSLRKLELDKRREVGLIVDNPSVVRGIQDVFEKDWAQTATGAKSTDHDAAQDRDAINARSAPQVAG